MRARFSRGLLLSLFVAACGGRVDGETDTTSAPNEPAPAANDIPSPSEQAGPERMAEGVGTPSALVLAGDRVVFTTRATVLGGQTLDVGGLFIVDKKTGRPLMLLVDRRGASYDALALTGSDAVVAASDGRIVRMPVSGGEETLVATLEARPVALATSGDRVFVATETGAVGRVAADGTFETLASLDDAARGIVADDKAIYVATENASGGAITRVPLDGSSSSVLAPAAGVRALIRDDKHLFWTAAAPNGDGSVMRASLADGKVETIASGAFFACALALDDSALYFATATPSGERVRSSAVGVGLMRAPISGGNPVPVPYATRPLTLPNTVAVDAAHVYWLTESAVLRLKK